jgi:hypothetical protein
MNDDLKITRKPGAPQPEHRHLESYIAREKPAPQPDLNRSVYDDVEREHAKRKNQP